MSIKVSPALLDLATGTGVVARAAAEITPSIVSIDPSHGMLVSGVNHGALVQGTAESIPARDASFDAITIGFALRHFADLAVVFRECHSVLRPNGRILILEITAPTSRPARALFGAYMGHVVPAGIRLRTRNARAAELFRYYWETTRDCVRPEVILDALSEAGFAEAERGVAWAGRNAVTRAGNQCRSFELMIVSRLQELHRDMPTEEARPRPQPA